MTVTLTKRQKEIVDFLEKYRGENGYSPTQREICERFGYSSFGTVQKHLRLLLEKGVLSREWNKRRSFVVAEKPRRAAALEIPLLGRIAAGQPIDVFQNEESVAVPEVLTKHGDSFVLRVAGDSMIDDGIFDGDYVVVKRAERAENGDLAVALVNGEATLKRYYRESNGRVRLQPANERMLPILVREDEVEVQGVVAGLMRRY